MHPRTLQRRFDRFAAVTGELSLRCEQVVLIMDAFYFHWTDGVLVCRTPTHVLYWKHIRTERVEEYASCLAAVTATGRTVISAVIDGRRGVRQYLERKGILVQCCQFHQIQTVKRYIPARARTEEARAFRAIALRLSQSMEIQMATALRVWFVLFESFLKERTISLHNKRGWQYTHRNVRSAYRSLKTNLPNLFTFERYPSLKIPKTTNHCDGLFSHIEEKVGIHRGLSRKRRKKMVDYLLTQWSP